MVRNSRDLFTPVVPSKRLDPQFRAVAEGVSHEAARTLLNAIFENFRDVDGNFVKDFQSSGFSARVFELALFAYIEEQNLQLDRTAPAPDFVVRGDNPVAIEVTTTNPAQGTPIDLLPSNWLLPNDLDSADQEFVFQLGKALRRKLIHRDAQGHAYWEKPHVEGVPFVIAVGAFHGTHAQFHVEGLLAKYLYGIDQKFSHNDAGDLTVTQHDVVEHHWKTKSIPSALFKLPEAADLSGVLFSNSHTMSKFNRIGIEQGLGNTETALARLGTCYDYTPSSATPSQFAYVVGDRPEDDLEDFCEGLHLFINPWARVPLSPVSLPGISSHTLRESDGLLETTFPTGFRPFLSKTFVFSGANAELFARYCQQDYLGLLKPGSPSFGELMGNMSPETTEGGT
ncbi:hypothetical protein ACFWWA_14640 [Streptomyces goshikiensis]|uniref:hypothetical protein n=1 Tax=Streptomyces goshikiensis TaxID=1942 RepID=UPI0036465473